MKYLPRKYREDTQDWFGKRGISWHIAVAFTKMEEVLQSLTFVHIFEGQVSQDSTVTTAVILDVVKMLQNQYPEVKSIHLWSDNAGCYKSSETISSSACDRTAAVMKSSIRRYVNEGNDVITAVQMKHAIEKMRKNVQHKVKVVQLDSEARQKFAAIPSISLYNNFKFIETGVHVWKHYGIGIGKTIDSQSLDSFPSANLKVIAAEQYNVPFHEIGQKVKENEQQNLFTCENSACVASFPTAQQLDDHLIVGDCNLKVDKERSSDVALHKYASKLLAKNAELYVLDCQGTTGTRESIPVKGWTLKEDRKSTRFSNKQKVFLENKFMVGLKSGRKEDPVTVSEEMRKVKTDGGERMFSYEELLTPQQIISFFFQNVQEVQKLSSQL